MRALSRVPAVSPLGPNAFIVGAICLCASLTLTASSEYGVPVEIKLWDTGRTPLAHMVDVTNEFGLKVLAEHNFLNDNNIAFSPYGLMGIMVALYEGVDGESSYQIQRGMQLPRNRNVMRIGFRDIHRTLKTYFVPEEGFLAGLALNNENVTFDDHYKTVLRFYGFDLDNDKLPTLSPETNTSTDSTNTMTSTNPTSSGASATTESMAATVSSQSTPPTREETTATTNPNAETIDIRGDTTTASPSSAPNAESTPMSTMEQPTSDRIAESTTQSVTTTTESVKTTTQAVPTTTQNLSSPETEKTTATVAQSSPNDEQSDSTDTQTSIASQATSAMTNDPTTNNEIDMTTTLMDGSQSTASDTTPSMSTSGSTLTTESTTLLSTETTMLESQQTAENVDSSSTTTMTSSTDVPALETLERRKKSIVDFVFTNPPYMDDYMYFRSYDIGGHPRPGYDDKMFLANGLKSIQVTYMRYDTVLECAYLPHLEASALRLPLDSDRYYLLVVLPARGGAPELGRLLSRMARESDLSDIYSVLRPRRVKGIVPSFTVKGHVTLTTDLQKLGIRGVFEPRQHDFTPMTKLPGVYVRSIEQAVSVAIRKYRPDDQKKNRYVTTREPLVFSATYPFLYFVMDANIHVALMAGKMVDPLNSRIL